MTFFSSLIPDQILWHPMFVNVFLDGMRSGMKMCHLFHNPQQGSILKVNPSPLKIVTIKGWKVGGGKKKKLIDC